ncbi:OTU-domain-containing protein [Hesseltinella vesiculosa]|uniref:Ubiquitin thioesterase OTU n=1 Tax=Hesseltinella vesiculosa TaxID=101127 RepID=A0A1X2GWB9_9FUNG|nr:OTU-domain-containing protein [Hesseltinella vesiculosa]
MRLRVRHAQGLLPVNDLEPFQTVQELCEVVESFLQVPSNQQVQLSGGFPPKPITDRSLTLNAANIRNGDTLTVQLVASAAKTTPSTAPAHPDIEPSLAAPTTTQPSATAVLDTNDGPYVSVNDAYLVQRVMDDDNSCLFRSLGYVIKRDTSLTMAAELRQVVADVITTQPDEYTEVVLGKPRDDYITWIKRPNSWGGAIELAIFSKYFGVEIVSVDVQTGRMDQFGQGDYADRVLILYSGIHYDALAMAPMIDSPPDFDQTLFPATTESQSILDAAKQLASKLAKQHKYTDVANFTLKCDICKKGIVGEKDAQAHAMSTGHTAFSEYA